MCKSANIHSTASPLSHPAKHATEQPKQDLQNLHRLFFLPEPALFKAFSISWRNVRRPLDDRIIPDSEYVSAEEGEDDLQASLDTLPSWRYLTRKKHIGVDAYVDHGWCCYWEFGHHFRTGKPSRWKQILYWQTLLNTCVDFLFDFRLRFFFAFSSSYAFKTLL